MSNVDPRTELFGEGLKSYPDVKQAVKAFEDLIGEIAKRVVSVHLDELKTIMLCGKRKSILAFLNMKVLMWELGHLS